MAETPVLSLVAPVYNGEAYIAESIVRIAASLERLGRPFEVIVVCDGSTDATVERARSVEDPRVVVLDYAVNEGKGHAITHGIARARGRLIGWLDSDLDIGPDVMVEWAQRFLAGEEVDAIIGSKRHRSSAVSYPVIRRVYSAGYQALVRVLFRIAPRDTQVGAKLFRREVLDTVAPLLLIKRYAYDLEVLAVGAEFGFDRVVEAPVELDYRFTGTGIDLKAVRRMLTDTLAIAYRIHIRHWYVRRFASLHRQRLDDEGTAAPPPGAPLAAAGAWPATPPEDE